MLNQKKIEGSSKGESSRYGNRRFTELSPRAWHRAQCFLSGVSAIIFFPLQLRTQTWQIRGTQPVSGGAHLLSP